MSQIGINGLSHSESSYVSISKEQARKAKENARSLDLENSDKTAVRIPEIKATIFADKKLVNQIGEAAVAKRYLEKISKEPAR